MVTANSTQQHPSYEDKRYIPRWEVQNRVLLQKDEKVPAQEAVSRDISCVGICVELKEDVQVNQKINLTIYLTDSVSIKVLGSVLWTKKTPQGILAGVIFEGTKPKTQQTILDYAFEIKRSDLVNHWFKGWDQ